MIVAKKHVHNLMRLQEAEICSFLGDLASNTGDLWTGAGVDGLREAREVCSIEDRTMRTRQPRHPLRIERFSHAFAVGHWQVSLGTWPLSTLIY